MVLASLLDGYVSSYIYECALVLTREPGFNFNREGARFLHPPLSRPSSSSTEAPYRHGSDRTKAAAFQANINNAADLRIDKGLLRSGSAASRIRDLGAVTAAIPNNVTHMLLVLSVSRSTTRTGPVPCRIFI
jgi:hypothetical protein